MSASLRADILGTEVEAEYRGSIYERTVKVRVDSSTVNLFEGKSHVTEEDIETTMTLVLLAHSVETVERRDIGEKEIVQISDEDDLFSKWRCRISGEVRDVDVRNTSVSDKYSQVLLLDVGSGTILVVPDESMIELIEVGSIRVGTNIRFDCSRIDIIDRLDGGA